MKKGPRPGEIATLAFACGGIVQAMVPGTASIRLSTPAIAAVMVRAAKPAASLILWIELVMVFVLLAWRRRGGEEAFADEQDIGCNRQLV